MALCPSGVPQPPWVAFPQNGPHRPFLQISAVRHFITRVSRLKVGPLPRGTPRPSLSFAFGLGGRGH